MTQPKGRPAIKPAERKKGITISASPWLIEWLNRQPVTRGEAVEQVARMYEAIRSQPIDPETGWSMTLIPDKKDTN